MSTNEELVARIQSGESDLMPQLWKNVEKFIYWKANRVLSALSATGLCHGIEIGDLVNSGFFAVVAAVETYNPSNSKFTVWLMYYLKCVFADVTGYRTEKQRNDLLRHCISTETPLDDESGDTLGDILPDPESAIPFEAVDESVYTEQLRQVLVATVEQIPPQQAMVIHQRYFDGATYREIANRLGVSINWAQQLEENGLRSLREPLQRKRLERFVECNTPYYLQVGSEQYQRTRESAVEKIVFLRDRLRRTAEINEA